MNLDHEPGTSAPARPLAPMPAPMPAPTPPRPLALSFVVGLLALGCVAGVIVNLVWLPGLMDFMRRGDGFASEGVSEASVYAGFLGGVVMAYGAMLLVLAFVWLRHRWARFAWIGCLAFALLTEVPWMALHWLLADTLASIDAIGAPAGAEAKVRVLLYTPQTFAAKSVVLVLLCIATPALFLRPINRWMRR